MFDPTDDTTLGEYFYDAHGRRVFRRADADRDGTIETELRYLYDGNQLIEERDAAGQTVREYVFGTEYADEAIWLRSAAKASVTRSSSTARTLAGRSTPCSTPPA